jgi:hypothetical protein
MKRNCLNQKFGTIVRSYGILFQEYNAEEAKEAWAGEQFWRVL